MVLKSFDILVGFFGVWLLFIVAMVVVGSLVLFPFAPFAEFFPNLLRWSHAVGFITSLMVLPTYLGWRKLVRQNRAEDLKIARNATGGN